MWTEVLEHVLAHLSPSNIQNLRLTSRALRTHPAILRRFSTASLPSDQSRQQLQAGLCFLQQLPELHKLELIDAKSTYGFQQLTQLQEVVITGCHKILDLCPLSQLPKMRFLHVLDCPAAQLDGLASLTQVTQLRISQISFHSEVSLLTSLKSLTIHPSNYEDDSRSENWPAYASLTGLSSLVDNACSKQHWHHLPNLEYLEVNHLIRSNDLDHLARLTQLRGLCIWLDEPGSPSAPTSFGPLTALVHLQRLELVDQALAIPALNALTSLRLHCHFPKLAGLPSLCELCLSVWGSVHLPNMAAVDFPMLTSIFYDDSGGRLSLSVRDHARFRYVYMPRMPCIDEDISEIV